MTIIKKQFTKNSIFSINMDLCYELWKIHNLTKPREWVGDTSTHNIKLLNHELIGKNLCRQTDGHDYTIESVHKQWYAGWYVALFLERNQSHHLIYWQNINCIEEIVLKSIEENNLSYLLLPKIEIP
jgi:hypothetical protein